MECCKEKPNYGRPACLEEITDATGVILAGKNVSANLVIKGQLASGFLPTPFGYDDLKALFFNSDQKERLFAMPQMNEVKMPVADSIIKEASNQVKKFIRKGKRSFEGQMWGKDASPTMYGKLAELRCGDAYGFIPLADNKLLGMIKKGIGFNPGDVVYYFSPIKFDSESLDPKLMFAEATEPNMIDVKFDFDRSFNEEELFVLDCNKLWSVANNQVMSLDLSNLPSVIDCDLLARNQNGTVVNITVNDQFTDRLIGGAGDTAKGNVTGLTVANFYCKNITQGTNEIITSVTEVNGDYEITHGVIVNFHTAEIGLVLADNGDGVPIYQGKVQFLIP